MSHRGVRYYCTMQAHHETWWEKVKRFFRLGNPAPEMGRKHIDPNLPYGHWANGWHAPAGCKRKER